MNSKPPDLMARARHAMRWRIRRARVSVRQYAGLIGWRNQPGPPTSPPLSACGARPQPLSLSSCVPGDGWTALNELSSSSRLRRSPLNCTSGTTTGTRAPEWMRPRESHRCRHTSCIVDRISGASGASILLANLRRGFQVVFIDDDQEFSTDVIENYSQPPPVEQSAAGGLGASSDPLNYAGQQSAPLPVIGRLRRHGRHGRGLNDLRRGRVFSLPTPILVCRGSRLSYRRQRISSAGNSSEVTSSS